MVTLAYAVELESVCVATADGALVLISADGGSVEQVGSVEGGVAAAAWSPGGDALLVVTGHGILLLMNQASTIVGVPRTQYRSCLVTSWSSCRTRGAAPQAPATLVLQY